jgi:hypothetical protein
MACCTHVDRHAALRECRDLVQQIDSDRLDPTFLFQSLFIPTGFVVQ